MKVCVTGASGFIAGHIVLQLLQKGYEVHGTVRSLKNKDKVQFLEEMSLKCGGKLVLFEADLLKEGTFDMAIAGCQVVIHTASPATFNTGGDPVKGIIEPAIKGTKNVLESCVRAGTVKHLVVTSSISAVRNYENEDPALVYNEQHWNTKSTPQTLPYHYAKTQAEKLAWDFVNALPEDKKFKLTTICPTMVIGPQLSDTVASSNSTVLSMVSGAYVGAPKFFWYYVDVRDVALAHILSFENPKATGRYIAAQDQGKWMIDVCNVLRTRFPHLPIPSKQLPNFVVYIAAIFDKRLTWKYLQNALGKSVKIDNSKARSELGINFRPFDQAVSETVQSFLDRNLVKPKKKNNVMWIGLVGAVLALVWFLFK